MQLSPSDLARRTRRARRESRETSPLESTPRIYPRTCFAWVGCIRRTVSCACVLLASLGSPPDLSGSGPFLRVHQFCRFSVSLLFWVVSCAASALSPALSRGIFVVVRRRSHLCKGWLHAGWVLGRLGMAHNLTACFGRARSGCVAHVCVSAECWGNCENSWIFVVDDETLRFACGWF